MYSSSDKAITDNLGCFNSPKVCNRSSDFILAKDTGFFNLCKGLTSTTTQAVSEAMGDLDKERADALQAVIDTGDYETIGRKVMMMALDYMERFAKDAAENEIND